MPLEILIPSLIWLAVALGTAAVLANLFRRRKLAGEARPNAPFFIAAVLALGGAAVPTTIQYIVTEGRAFWAGVPLTAVSLWLLLQGLTRKPDKPRRPAIMTFREKSALVTVLAIVAIYGFATWQALRAPMLLPVAAGWLIGTSVLMAIMMTISHIILALVREPETEDERDRFIGLRATRNGYWVMAFGVWGVAMLVFVGAPPALLIYAVIGVFVLAELSRLASELVYFRLPV